MSITSLNSSVPSSADLVEELALCRSFDAEAAHTIVGLFFSEKLSDIARAKALCNQCPVRTQCLQGALGRREPWGVWGGELLVNGRVLVNKRGRGRPRKQAQVA